MRFSLRLLVVAFACMSTSAWAASNEMANARRWAAEPRFSFVYGGRPSDELLKNWTLKKSSKKLDKKRTENTLAWTDPDTGLVVRCVVVKYNDFPTVEWTLHFKNSGTNNTPIISDIQALDARIERSGDTEFILHHHEGTRMVQNDYEPLTTILKPNTSLSFAPPGGRPLGKVFPYFNLEWQGEGVIIAVGWTGQWAAKFTRDASKSLSLRAGQELTHFKLLPSEEVRSPLIAMQFYKGDWIHSQNVWRRWMVAHNVPRPGGKLPTPQLNPASSYQFGEMMNANEENQKLFIDRYLEEGIKIDYWWMDAGWYICGGAWTNTGTWEVDTKRFPNGLRAISDHAHKKDVKTIVWFQPEVVAPSTWLADNHQEWLLGETGMRLLDLGNPEALKWLTNHIDKMITEQGIDIYRQDFNIDPLPFWKAKDAEDRQGITENHYVTGYYAYWDELLRRHPNLLIDSCASGGHRNDLETMRRAVPLLDSDCILVADGAQGHTYGSSFWLPFRGTAVIALDNYNFRSAMCSALVALYDVRRTDIDYAAMRRLITEWKSIAPNYYGDYYPLTPYSLATNVWMAWQFDQPEAGEGIVQAFRRPEAKFRSCRLKLFGLDAMAQYAVRNLDEKEDLIIRGQELMSRGLLVTIPDKPGAVVITYKKVK